MPIVNVAGVGRVNFPEGMTREEMQEAIHRNLQLKNTSEAMQSQPNDGQFMSGIDAFNAAASEIPRGVLAPLLRRGYLGEEAKKNFENYDLGQREAEKESAQNYPVTSGLASFAGGVAGSSPLLEVGGFGMSGLRRLLAQAGTQSGIIGGLREPGQGENRLTNALESGAEGLGVGGGIGLVGKIRSALRPSNLLRGQVPAEELARRLEVTKGTETPLGDIIENGPMKGAYENVLKKLPFTGASGSLQRTGEQLKQKGGDILEALGGAHQGEYIPELISDELEKSYNIANKEKNKIYQAANNMAENSGLKLELPEFANTANDFKEALEGTNILQFEPEARKLLTKFKSYINPVKMEVNKEGQVSNVIHPSLQEAGLLKGQMNRLAAKYGKSADSTQRDGARVFGQLAKSLRKDISSGLGRHGNEELSNAWKEAEKNYGEKFAPFLDKNVYKFIGGDADSDLLISNFVKTGRTNDRANLINKLIKVLPEDKKKLVGYHVISQKAIQDNAIKPEAISAVLRNLGKRQKQALFSPEDLKKLEHFKDLVGLNPEASKALFNPPTGQRIGDLVGLSAILGGAKVGSMIGGIPGAIIGGAAAPVAGKLAAKTLTSEKVRESLVNKMIQMDKKKALASSQGNPAKLALSNALIQLMNQNTGNP